MIKIDTDKVRDSGRDLKVLNNKLREEVEALKKRISGITSTTLEWEGAAANKFVETSIEELNQLNLVIESINGYANELIMEADDYQSVILTMRP